MNHPNNLQPESSKTNCSGQYLKAPASQGSVWLTHAIQLVKKSPQTWLGISSFLIFMMAIPPVNVLVAFSIPITIGGIMIGCRNDKTTSPFKFDHLFAGLKNDIQELLLLSGYYTIASLLVSLTTYLFLLLMGIDFQDVLSQFALPAGTVMTEKETIQWFSTLLENNTFLHFLLGILVYLALTIPVLMGLWFSPALVVLQKIPAAKAIKISYKACADNFMPLLVFGLVALGYLLVIYFVIFILTALIQVLGILLILFSFVALLAISLASMYSCYQGIFSPYENTEIEIEDQDPDSNSSMLA